MNEGVVFSNEESIFSGKLISLVVFIAIKQLLQIQKGEQGESSQGSGFCVISELISFSILNIFLAIVTMPPPPSPQGASDRKNI